MIAVKTWSSCIRVSDFPSRVAEQALCPAWAAPRAGDIVLLEVLDEHGYAAMENCHGRDVRLNAGDLVFAVLGNRFSGTNNFGRVPEGELRRGDTLSILSVSGISGVCKRADAFQASQKTRGVKVLGFPTGADGTPLNIAELNQRPQARDSSAARRNPLFVFGTSAEAGKTTFVCKLVRSLQAELRVGSVAAFKVAGTGRLKDSLTHQDWGATCVSDFVAFGHASTYGVEPSSYAQFLSELVQLEATLDFRATIFEVGGDLLEANAPAAVQFAARRGCRCVLVLNDAMGAQAGLQTLMKAGISADAITLATLKQNPFSASQRLGQRVFGVGDAADVRELAGSLFE